MLWFPKPGSYTGEDCVELHLHGGPAVIEAVSEALRRAGGRPAEPGEFTQRAFLTGRLDLIEAEGIADLIEAETNAQRRQALAQSTGALSDIYRKWSVQLRRLMALQEASIDFPDETGGASDQVVEQIAELETALEQHLSEGRKGESLRRGLMVAVVGAPNVGKSSLVNILANRDVSIVSERAGTTRDVVQARVTMGGVPVTLIDTAGLRDSDDDIEREGVRRARRSAEASDFIILVTCGDRPILPVFQKPTLWVANKVDIVAAPSGALGVSARTGEGIDTLRRDLATGIQRLVGGTTTPLLTRARHRDCVETTVELLRSARDVSSPELRGEELRLALHNLGRLTGEVDVEDVLGEIFATFCIGK